MTIFPVGRRWASKVRVAPGKRGRISRLLPEDLTEEQAQQRDELLNRIARELRATGQLALIERTVDELAAASPEELPRLVGYVEKRLVSGSRKPREHDLTFQQFAERWTSGQLARQYPDRVKAKDSSDDRARLRDYVLPILGPKRLVDIELDDLEEVLSSLPSSLSPGTRRHVAQVMARVMRLAAMPAKLIPSNLIPEGFLPAVGRVQFPFLRPREEAFLQACEDVPVLRRLFYGFVCREGFRLKDLSGLAWDDLDLKEGTIVLGRHKTVEHTGARSWRLRPDCTQALSWLLEIRPTSAGPFEGLYTDHLAEQLRGDLQLAGVSRPELFTRERGRGRLTEHCLRRTFVTLELAQGKSDAWVTDRTGHTTTQQLARYKAAARHAAELELGPLLPLGEIVPELVRYLASKNRGETPSKTHFEDHETLDTLEASGCLGSPSPRGQRETTMDQQSQENVGVVRKEGLEPPRREAAEPKSVADPGTPQIPRENPSFDPPPDPPKTRTRQRLDSPLSVAGLATLSPANDCPDPPAAQRPPLLHPHTTGPFAPCSASATSRRAA